jgi:uncharacterized protein YdhG (YjbR/CyaY superfamily)
MPPRMTHYDSVNDYLKAQPPSARKLLTQLRKLIRELAPDAEESISYSMPAYKLNGPLVYFGAFAKHYSLFAMPTTQIKFKDKLKDYHTSKGTIQFSYDQPLPEKLIREIVTFRVKENREKEIVKKKKA